MLRSVSLLLVVLAVAANAATILQIAESLPQFSTLVALSSSAGIAPLLSGPGYKTVFAPTNSAFGQLSNSTVAWLVNAHNQQHLLATLYYHITPGALTTAFLKSGQHIPTLDFSSRGGAQTISVEGDGSSVRINGAQISQADVVADNGVIQVIDRVLVPENIDLPSKDIVETAQSVPTLSTLVKAVVAAGLAPALSRPNGPYVVFAPTDQAFAALPQKLLECLLGNVPALQQVLLLHVVSGLVYSEQIVNGTAVPTLNKKLLTLNVAGNTVLVSPGAQFAASQVILPNVDTSNGVVHVIDKVLFDNSGPCATFA